MEDRREEGGLGRELTRVLQACRWPGSGICQLSFPDWGRDCRYSWSVLGN